MIAGKWCGLLLLQQCVCICFDFASLASHSPCRSTFGLGSKARRTYDIVRRMTSLLISEGWASLCRIASVERSLTGSRHPGDPSVVESCQCTLAGKI